MSFTGLDYSLDHHHQFMKPHIVGENSGDNNTGMVDYMFNNPPPQQNSPGFSGATSLDRLSFAEVMQFADFGPKLALNQAKIPDEENGIDPVYFLKFPVLNDRLQDQSVMIPPLNTNDEEKFQGLNIDNKAIMMEEEEGEEEEGRVSENTLVRLRMLGGSLQKSPSTEARNRRKRTRSVKTSEEVESQRMTHIAVERNRRKQMNEHLRVLRSLMPSSYVQRVCYLLFLPILVLSF